jgi:hypothetical protein
VQGIFVDERRQAHATACGCVFAAAGEDVAMMAIVALSRRARHNIGLQGALHQFVVSFATQFGLYHTFISIDVTRGLCFGA